MGANEKRNVKWEENMCNLKKGREERKRREGKREITRKDGNKRDDTI